MCGFFITNASVLPRDAEKILEQTLRFRGPDYSSGLIEYKGWYAYHSRLSIIDLNEEANQPICLEDSGLLVFNGEVLNYKELGKKYFSKNYESDTLLLFDLLKEKKLDLNELDGFFAFVFINEFGELTHASRDKFGVKPLFRYSKGNQVSYCSEPNPIRQLFGLQVDSSAIEEYKLTRAPIFSSSFFKGISQVEVGTCDINGTYFNIVDHITSNYESCDINALDKALRIGIETRKVSDAPVGLLLSKGVDSNLVNSCTNFSHKYSIGFKGDADFEYLKSQDIPNLNLVECTSEQYKNSFEYLLKLRGEPLSVPNEVMLYIIAKAAAKDGVKVLLSGEGADEFFAGYDRVFNWANHTSEFELEQFLKLYCYSAPNKSSVVYRNFEELFSTVDHLCSFEKVRWFFIKYHMPILFRRLDFSLMAAGVEGREPIANIHLFTEAVKICSKQLMNKELGKIPLRELLSKHMTREFSYEQKVGFPVKVNEILENPENLTSYDLWFKKNLEVLN
ncbi:hypothetical protein JQC92_08300 [Shewanella sp. 202IG2-18]|uniref:asparagine synthetase B family protein n=1 Tax=Parashewanella hymeniacidonis TaxID=2807618 RepID=UPI001960FACC|nr:asparagine synthase-related protein [Parashewanella hymeniacidonis]MBM7072029.1 hypothetical protein [Parashewanella hymeniacidonis]